MEFGCKPACRTMPSAALMGRFLVIFRRSLQHRRRVFAWAFPLDIRRGTSISKLTSSNRKVELKLVCGFSKFHKHGGFNADSVLDADLFAQLATDTVFRFNQFADAEEAFGVFAGLWVLEFKTIPRANMDTEVAARAKFFVDNGDRSVRGTTNKFAHLSELVTDRLDWTDHPARAAINANIRIDDV